MVSISRDRRTKISCSICCIGLVIIVVWAAVIGISGSAVATYENNDNVDMDLTHVTGSVVVWGTGQASITQRFYFILEPYSSYYGSYTLEGIYWETNERVLANSTKVSIYTKSGTPYGPTYFSSYVKDTTKTPSVAVVSGGKQINVNGLAFYGSAKVYWMLEVSYNSENQIMFYDDGRTLPEGQTLPGTLVGDKKTQFVFFPPTFSQDSNTYANYTYDIILANRTLTTNALGYEFNQTSLGVNSTFLNNVANFTWVSNSQGKITPNFFSSTPKFVVENVTDSAGTQYTNCCTIIVNEPLMSHTYDETDDFISFDINGTAMGVYGPMEHPNQSFNTGLPYLSSEAQYLILFLGGGGLVIFLAIFTPFLYVKIAGGVQRAREHAKLEKERKAILERLNAKGFVVPKKSQENVIYLRALEETIYSEHYQELFDRAEITREDLMTDQNQDGKVDEKDIEIVVEKQMRTIFEKDILDELQKGGLIE